MTPHTARAPGYSAPALGAVFHLPTPDRPPLHGPTRLAIEWEDRRWIEIDPATGECMASGCAYDDGDEA